MIENENQYRITQAWLNQFEKTLAHDREFFKSEDIHPLLYQARINGLESMIEELREQITEWEQCTRWQNAGINAFSVFISGVTVVVSTHDLGTPWTALRYFYGTTYHLLEAEPSEDTWRQFVRGFVEAKHIYFETQPKYSSWKLPS